MPKEQIQQKFENILKGYGYKFFEDGVLETTYLTKDDLIELLEEGFNLGLEVAADNADADITILSEEGQYELQNLVAGQDYEVYCLKESILKHRL